MALLGVVLGFAVAGCGSNSVGNDSPVSADSSGRESQVGPTVVGVYPSASTEAPGSVSPGAGGGPAAAMVGSPTASTSTSAPSAGGGPGPGTSVTSSTGVGGSPEPTVSGTAEGVAGQASEPSGTGGATAVAGSGGSSVGGSSPGGSSPGGSSPGGSSPGGAGPSPGAGGQAASGGAAGSGDLSVATYPTPPGAVESDLYTVTVNGEPVFVEHMTKFGQEMQVHYAHCSLPGDDAATVTVQVGESFNNYQLSPKSRNIDVQRSGDTLTFESGPNYLILAVDQKELLFLFLDPPEVDPPQLGDPDVKSIADYGVDATGQTLETSKIQAAIDAASGSAQNILYFPPGKYLVGELWLKSDMTVYLAGGAVLYGSNTTGDFNTGGGGIDIEGCQHGMIRMYQVSNTKLLGRGVIDANGKSIRAQNDTKINLIKIEQSSDILIDGVLVRDPSFWNTLIYRSDGVDIENYKMVNCRPTTTTYNNTDGVDFDESTNGRLYNAFLYTGDDSMATKNEEPQGTVNTDNIVHEHVVAYSNSVGCKIGTKTMGQSITGVVFRDIDVVKAGRALDIDAYDTAVVDGTVFEDIRVEAADSILIALEESMPPDWRDAANQSIIRNTSFTNVASDVSKSIDLHGGSDAYGVEGVHFKNFTVRGNAITSTNDPNAQFSVNAYATGITFE